MGRPGNDLDCFSWKVKKCSSYLAPCSIAYWIMDDLSRVCVEQEVLSRFIIENVIPRRATATAYLKRLRKKSPTLCIPLRRVSATGFTGC